jgi:hypothetical protein
LQDASVLFGLRLPTVRSGRANPPGNAYKWDKNGLEGLPSHLNGVWSWRSARHRGKCRPILKRARLSSEEYDVHQRCVQRTVDPRIQYLSGTELYPELMRDRRHSNSTSFSSLFGLTARPTYHKSGHDDDAERPGQWVKAYKSSVARIAHAQ